MLKNPNFTEPWAHDHQALKIVSVPGEGYRYDWIEVGNIFTPPEWSCYFYHQENELAQPEVRYTNATNPTRFTTGGQGLLLFTFHRKHHAGFMQTVDVGQAGKECVFSVAGHAWSNHSGDAKNFPHPDDPRWSDGAGYSSAVWEAGSDQVKLTGDPQQDAKCNFLFRVGIDPYGGKNPTAGSIVWSLGLHVYNSFTRIISPSVIALRSSVTVFMETETKWAFKHNDAYWDSAVFTITEQVKDRGDPRVQYARIYVYLPQTITRAQAHAVLDKHFDAKHTIGFSGDDAGIGDLDERKIIAVGLEEKQQDEHQKFWNAYYPGVSVTFEPMPEDDEDPPPPPKRPVTLINYHQQRNVGGIIETLGRLHDAGIPMGTHKLVHIDAEMSKEIRAVSQNTLIVFRHVDNDVGAYHGGTTAEQVKAAVNRFLDHFWGAIERNPEITAVESLNETIATHDKVGIEHTVRFDIEFCKEVHRRSGGRVRPIILTAPPGNPDHGAEVRWLIPAVEAACEYNGILGPHTYWGAIPDRKKTDHWFETEGKHFQLRPLLSWQAEFSKAGLYPDYLFGETGPVEVWVREDGRPGGFKDSGAGWRRCLNGNLEWLCDMLLRYQEQIKEVDSRGQVLGTNFFTTGPWGWENFRFDKTEWDYLTSRLIAEKEK